MLPGQRLRLGKPHGRNRPLRIIAHTTIAAIILAVLWIAPAANSASDNRSLKHTVHPCLAELIRRESNWNHRAVNRSSGAYGLPQALPGHKMRSAGHDWRTNPRTQIRWMVGYVNARYGGACQALSFHNRNGWY